MEKVPVGHIQRLQSARRLRQCAVALANAAAASLGRVVPARPKAPRSNGSCAGHEEPNSVGRVGSDRLLQRMEEDLGVLGVESKLREVPMVTRTQHQMFKKNQGHPRPSNPSLDGNLRMRLGPEAGVVESSVSANLASKQMSPSYDAARTIAARGEAPAHLLDTRANSVCSPMINSTKTGAGPPRTLPTVTRLRLHERHAPSRASPSLAPLPLLRPEKQTSTRLKKKQIKLVGQQLIGHPNEKVPPSSPSGSSSPERKTLRVGTRSFIAHPRRPPSLQNGSIDNDAEEQALRRLHGPVPNFVESDESEEED
jgi:hypothetical protein